MAWNDIANQSNGTSNGGSNVKYVKLKPGTTKIRVLNEEPKSRWTHWIPQANGGKGLSVDCIGKGCPICTLIAADKRSGNKKSKYSSSKSHAINVLVRSFQATPSAQPEGVNEVQILDKGNKIFAGMLAIMNQMGDLRNYDITITQVGEGLGNINYTVLPVFPPTALTTEELALEKYDLSVVNKTFNVEQLNALIGGATLEAVQAMAAPADTSVPFDVAPQSGSALAGIGVDFTRQA